LDVILAVDEDQVALEEPAWERVSEDVSAVHLARDVVDLERARLNECGNVA
jgi:hypothetical protein